MDTDKITSSNDQQENKKTDIVYVVSQEIRELTDGDKDNDEINLTYLEDALNRNFKDNLKNALKVKPGILNQMISACEKYMDENKDYCDKYPGLVDLYETLQAIKKDYSEDKSENLRNSNEQIEIKPNNINVTLRWKRRDLDWDPLKEAKQKIADTLNKYAELWDYLPGSVKHILRLASEALASTSDATNDDKSSEVLLLETALDMPNTPSSAEIHDSVDWKFWDKTFDALIKYIEWELKTSATIDENKINTTLYWEWKEHPESLENNKKEIASKLNDYVQLWGYLDDPTKQLLLLANKALKTPTKDPANWTDEVKLLQNKLGDKNGDWKFWNKTYEKLTQVLDNKIKELKKSAEIQETDIKVTLRWAWKDKDRGIICKSIAADLNNRNSKWEELLPDQRVVLLMARSALTTESHDDDKWNPISDEVYALEYKLNKLNYMPKEADNGNNWVDWKFGTKTYEALAKCLGIDNPVALQGLTTETTTSTTNTIKNSTTWPMLLDNNIDKTDTSPETTTNNKNIIKKFDESTDWGILGYCDDLLKKIPENSKDYRLPDIKRTLEAIKEILNNPTTKNIKSLQDFIYTYLYNRDPETVGSLDEYNNTEYNDGHWTWNLMSPDFEKSNTLERVVTFLGIKSAEVDDIKEHPQLKDPNAPDGTPDVVDDNPDSPQTYVSFDQLVTNLPIKDNQTINEYLWQIQALNNQLLEWKSINELKKEIEKISNEITNATQTNQMNEWNKSQRMNNIKEVLWTQQEINEDNLPSIKKDLISQKKDFEKQLKKKKNNENPDLEKKINKINEVLGYIQQIENNQGNSTKIKTLETEKTKLQEQLDKKNDTKTKIETYLDNITELLNAEKDSTDEIQKTAIDKYINEDLTQYRKWLDWEIKDNIKWNISQVTENMKNNQGNSEQKNKPTRSDFFNRLQSFEWEKWAWFQNIINFFNLLFWKSNIADQLKGKEYIDSSDKDVMDNLSNIMWSTKKVDWLNEIKNTIEHGDTKKIKDLQMKLWTPENRLNITGIIDKNTVLAIQTYINNNSWDSTKPLGFCCLKNLKNITVSKDYSAQWITWTLYKGTDAFDNSSYIYIWNNKWTNFICTDPKVSTTDTGKTISFDNPNTIIQLSDGRRYEWVVQNNNGELTLQSWTQYDKEWKVVTQPQIQQNPDTPASGNNTQQ